MSEYSSTQDIIKHNRQILHDIVNTVSVVLSALYLSYVCYVYSLNMWDYLYSVS